MSVNNIKRLEDLTWRQPIIYPYTPIPDYEYAWIDAYKTKKLPPLKPTKYDNNMTQKELKETANNIFKDKADGKSVFSSDELKAFQKNLKTNSSDTQLLFSIVMYVVNAANKKNVYTERTVNDITELDFIASFKDTSVSEQIITITVVKPILLNFEISRAVMLTNMQQLYSVDFYASLEERSNGFSDVVASFYLKSAVIDNVNNNFGNLDINLSNGRLIAVTGSLIDYKINTVTTTVPTKSKKPTRAKSVRKNNDKSNETSKKSPRRLVL